MVFKDGLVPVKYLLYITKFQVVLFWSSDYSKALISDFLLPNSGESGEEIAARLKRDLLPTLINGAMFWPICDFVTYKFVPVHLQV